MGSEALLLAEATDAGPTIEAKSTTASTLLRITACRASFMVLPFPDVPGPLHAGSIRRENVNHVTPFLERCSPSSSKRTEKVEEIVLAQRALCAPTVESSQPQCVADFVWHLLCGRLNESSRRPSATRPRTCCQGMWTMLEINCITGDALARVNHPHSPTPRSRRARAPSTGPVAEPAGSRPEVPYRPSPPDRLGAAAATSRAQA